MQLHDRVHAKYPIKADIPAGCPGTIVHVYFFAGQARGYEVEFFDHRHQPINIVTCLPCEIHLLSHTNQSKSQPNRES